MPDAPLADAPIALRDFRIDAMSLIASNGNSVDIRELVVELIIRQDIFTNYMHGEMVIYDGVELLTTYGIHGNEYLQLELHEPEVDTRIKKVFRVYKLTDRTPVSATAQSYKLFFVSEEMFTSNLKLVSKAYKGISVSSIVEDVFVNYLDMKKYTIENTDASMDIILANQRPTEAVNWLAQRASIGDKNAFLFYENLDGFRFESLHSLYEQAPCNTDKIRFEAKIAEADLRRNKFNMDKFKSIRDFDALTLSGKGGVSMRLLGIDPIHRVATAHDYDMNRMTKMYDNPALANLTELDGVPLYDHYESRQITYPNTQDTASERSQRVDKWISRSLSLANIKNSLMDVVLPGNMILQAGKLADIDMPNMIAASRENMTNETRSGKYLIVSVAHKFNMPQSTFDTVATISRDSYPEFMITHDISLRRKVKKLNG